MEMALNIYAQEQRRLDKKSIHIETRLSVIMVMKIKTGKVEQCFRRGDEIYLDKDANGNYKYHLEEKTSTLTKAIGKAVSIVYISHRRAISTMDRLTKDKLDLEYFKYIHKRTPKQKEFECFSILAG